MPDPVNKMSDQAIANAAKDLGGADHYLFIQGYPFTTFARLDNGQIVLPPADLFDPAKLVAWRFFFDVRLFNENGEVHFWNDGRGNWTRRIAKRDDWKDHHIERNYVLWGTRIEPKTGGWALLSEDRGAEVWVPDHFTGADLPIRLKMHLRVGRDEDTGLAGIVDSMILDFTGRNGGLRK